MASPASETVIHPELADLLRQFEAIVQDAQAVSDGLTDDQFNWRPSGASWSIAECLVHLDNIDHYNLPAIQAEMERARAAGIISRDRRAFRYGWFSRFFVSNVEPPPRIKVNVPKTVPPPPRHASKAQTMDDFVMLRARIGELIRGADGLDLRRVKVPVPFSKRIKFSLGQRFALMTAHNRRHLWQAWQVRNHPSFPR